MTVFPEQIFISIFFSMACTRGALLCFYLLFPFFGGHLYASFRSASIHLGLLRHDLVMAHAVVYIMTVFRS